MKNKKRKWFCPKCGKEWITIKPNIKKLWCVNCNRIMREIKDEEE